MGTYTTNYQLYMPTIGENGWGDLVNGNFSTIDTTMKGLSNRITAVENEVNGALSCTSVTTSGKVTANGGLSTKALTGTTGTFSEVVTAKNINMYGLIPFDIVLSATDREDIYAQISRPNLITSVVQAGQDYQFTLLDTVPIYPNGITTDEITINHFRMFKKPSDGSEMFYLRDIRVKSGSWGYNIYTNHADITAKVTTEHGTVFSNISQTKKSITFAQFKELATSICTIEATYSGTNSYQNGNIFIQAVNTSSNRQYCYDTWVGLE